MEQVIFAGYVYGAPLPQTDTRYNILQGGYTWAIDEYYRWQVISTDGVIRNLGVRLEIAPGAGKKYTFTLFLNGNPTALTFDIADAAKIGSDMVNEVAVTGGDTVTIECVPDGTPTYTGATYSAVFVGDNPNESLILGRPSGSVNRNNTVYGQVMTSGTSLSDAGGAENDRRQVIPTSGKIKNFYVVMNIDPGTPPDAYRFTVRLNGATVAQSPIVTITANDKTGSDLVHELAVVAGDYITMMIEPLNTPSLWPIPGWGLTFEADIDGESIVIGGSYNALDTNSIRYAHLSSTEGNSWDVNENRTYQLGQVCTLKKLNVLITAAAGIGKEWDFNLSIGEVASNVTATIADPGTTGDSGALEDTVSLFEHVSISAEPFGGVANAADAYWGFVCYISPSGSEDLLGKFDVGQDSADLLSHFEVGQGSADLLGKVEVQQSASADLLARFEAQSTAELLGKVEVQQSASADLLARFEAQSTAELLGNAVIRQSGSADLLTRFEAQSTAELLAKVEVQQSASAELLGKVEIGQSGSAELLGKGIIRQSASAELLGRVEVQQSGSAELLGRVEVQQSGSADLLGRFEAQSTAELLGNGVIRQSGSAELLAKVEVQQSASAELLGKVEIGQSGSAELLGRANVQVPGSVELLSNVKVQQSGSADLLGNGIIRHSDAAELLGKVEVQHSGSAELLDRAVIRHVGTPVELLGNAVIGQFGSAELLGNAVIRQPGSAELLGNAEVINIGSAELLGKFAAQVTAELRGNAVIRQPGSAESLGKFIVKHSAELDLPAKLQVTHSERLLSKLWIRHPYRLWTNRRYINGVVELDENELSDALLEYVVQGVMDDIKSLLISEAMLIYDSWTDITVTPKLIRRATTYGTVAGLYSRDINDPNRRIVLGLRTIRIRAAQIRSAQERAMDYWETRMEKMMDLFLTSGERKLIIVDTEDEEPVFSLEDIPFYSEDPYKIEVRPS